MAICGGGQRTLSGRDRDGRAHGGGGGDHVVWTSTALDHGRLVAVLGSCRQTLQNRITKKTWERQRQEGHQGPTKPPFIAGARAGAVHPAVLLVSVLSHLLPTMIEGSFDTTHAADRIDKTLGRAETRVITQPRAGQRLGSPARGTPTPSAHHTDDRI